MDLLTHIRRQFAYDHWATLEALAAIRAAEPAPPKASERLSHVLWASALWWHRITGTPRPPAQWPVMTSEVATRLAEENRSRWDAYLATLPPAGLEAAVDYVNTRGEPFRNTAWDICTHVVLHGQHHRGQIAADLRSAGHTPPVLDFIHAVRTGRV